jgi:hypothetical protein
MKNLALVAALTAMFGPFNPAEAGSAAARRPFAEANRPDRALRDREQDRERIEAAEIKRQRKAAKRLREQKSGASAP